VNYEEFASLHCECDYNSPKKKCTISLKGNLDYRNSSTFLKRFFEEVISELSSRNIKSLTINCLQLIFLNSNAMLAFVEIVSLINQLPEQKKFSIFFITENELNWQWPFLTTLKHISHDYVFVLNKQNEKLL
jgi:hypothetical protein